MGETDFGEREAGPPLDRLIELRVFGRKPVTTVPPYSTDEEAAELVVARLNRPPLRWASVKDGEQWTFHWRRPFVVEPVSASPALSRYTKIVSAAAPTRALAICRAALKLVDSLRPTSPPSDPPAGH